MADPKRAETGEKNTGDVHDDDRTEEDVDTAIDDSFPASDPPAWTSDSKVGTPDEDKKD